MIRDGLMRAALLLAMLPVAACNSSGEFDLNIFSDDYFAANPPETLRGPPCPRPAIADGAGNLSRFAGSGTASSDLAFEAWIADIEGDCGYDDNVIDIDMNVTIVGRRGPAGSDGGQFTYFVALVRNDGTIIDRRAFAGEIDLVSTQSRGGFVDEIEQTVTLSEGEDGANYTIIVGFELTPEELEYNRQKL